jgi:hypothetical protein
MAQISKNRVLMDVHMQHALLWNTLCQLVSVSSTKSLFGKLLLTSLPGLPDTDYGDSMIFQNAGVCLPTRVMQQLENGTARMILL